MKKIINFFTEYGYKILIAVAIIAFLVVFVIPLLIAIGRDMWNIAINDPYILSQ